MADIARIEDRIDRVAASSIGVSGQLGGIDIRTQIDAMEIAKVMALGKISIPAHLRNNPGDCWAIIMLANEWRMSPIQVANKSYSVNNRIAFEASLLQGVVLQRAPIKGRIKVEYEGEAEHRTCRVWAQLRDEDEKVEYTSPVFNKITPKNSPLWKTDPDQQLFYFSVRALCKRHFPDVLMGIFSRDELEDNPHFGPDNAKDVNDRPSVGQRLKSKGHRGFNASHVEQHTRGGVVDDSASTKTESSATDAHRHPDRAETLDGSSVGGDNASLTGKAGQAGETPVTESSSSQPASSPTEAETDAPATDDAPSPAVAGNQSESSATPSDDEGGGDGSGQLPSSLLPQGWEITYSSALRRAQKKESLPKYASEFWKQYGGWDEIKKTDARETAVAIYDAFANNFGNKAQIDMALRELI